MRKLTKRLAASPARALRSGQLRVWFLAGLSLSALGACASSAPASAPLASARVTEPAATDSRPPAAAHSSRWRDATGSDPSLEPSPEDRALLDGCAGLDEGLMRAATRMAEHQARTERLPDNDQVVFELRVAGVPQVWPRVWALAGDASAEQTQQGVSQWLASFDDGGSRRCGVGHAQTNHGPIVVVVALDAIAELQPMPRRARLGQWLQVRAPLLLPASSAEVVVLGPRGAPYSVPASLSAGTVSARVPVDQPGQWLIQVLPTLESGPRPAAEALVFVDEEPSDTYQTAQVPGEQAAHAGLSPSAALLSMLNTARASERLAALRPNAELQRVAEQHARAMLDAGRVAHNLGDGDPAQRVAARGLMLSITGENVARAESVVRAHRALWGSPSHRGNMLLQRFTEVGIGVADSDGVVWVCEVFGAF